MGQQQLLLIILGVIIVGIAIAVGLSMFSSQSISSNKDAIINDLNNLFANAYQYRIRPVSMGGGGGAYDNSKGGSGYQIPATLSSNENAYYTETVDDADHVTFDAVSSQDTTRTVSVQIDGSGRPVGSTWTYSGDFQ